jgi:hypothetical protein
MLPSQVGEVVMFCLTDMGVAPFCVSCEQGHVHVSAMAGIETRWGLLLSKIELKDSKKAQPHL